MIGVYHLKHDGEVVYVGQSKDIERRIKQHKRDGKVFDGYEAFQCSIKDLNSLEKIDIVKLTPKLNKHSNPMSPSDKNLAIHIGTTAQTLHNWKTSDDEGLRRRYKIFKDYFITYCNNLKDKQC